MHTLLFDKRTMSGLYNMLPTRQRRQLDEFNRRWRQFNLEIIQRARNQNLDCPFERIYTKGVQGGDMTLVEVRVAMMAPILLTGLGLIADWLRHVAVSSNARRITLHKH
jgi:hypothetical protein